jgi:hypothetical protein
MIVPRSLKIKRNIQFFKLGQIFYLILKSYLTVLYLLIIEFPKFDLLTATGMAFILGQYVKFYSP